MATGSAPRIRPRLGVDRAATVAELRALESELAGRDRAVAELLMLLADAVENDRPEDVRAYAAAIPPRTVADDLTQKHRTWWGVAEVIRGALVLMPIAFTWYGLSAASTAYAELLDERPELIVQPFLLLWQRGFEGRDAITFSALAAIDGLLITVIIGLSFVIHYKAEVRDPRLLAQALLRESQVRGLLARALALSPSTAPIIDDGDGRTPMPAALAATIQELHGYAGHLSELVDVVRASTDQSTAVQRTLLEQSARAAARQSDAAASLDSIRRELSLGAHGVGAVTAEGAAMTVSEQTTLVQETRQLIASIEEVKQAQQIAMGSVTLQTDAMNYMAKALVLASERVQVAAQALGDATVTSAMFPRRGRLWRLRRLGPYLLIAAGGTAIVAMVADLLAR